MFNMLAWVLIVGTYIVLAIRLSDYATTCFTPSNILVTVIVMGGVMALGLAVVCWLDFIEFCKIHWKFVKESDKAAAEEELDNNAIGEEEEASHHATAAAATVDTHCDNGDNSVTMRISISNDATAATSNDDNGGGDLEMV